MKKISTLFKKDPSDLGRVINQVNPENQWVFDGEAIACRKYDGTACAVIDGKLFKRYDVKKGKSVPPGAIPCQEPDEITGHCPHWIECDRDDPANRWHFEAFDSWPYENGTYELIGPKVQGNPEAVENHMLINHKTCSLPYFPELVTWDSVIQFLKEHDIEGVVFHHKSDERMCKIRRADFGIKRGLL